MKLISALTLALAVASSAQAATPLTVSGAWSRPAVVGTTGVGYLVVANGGKAADTLVRVESPVAARVEMHSSSMAGGVMSMKREDRVPVPAGGQAAFAPGGYHLMLIGLTKTLKAGDKVPATLTFASGAKLHTAFAVGTGAGPPAMGPMHH
ncbi:MAG: copper chaperone PCu(A)C [Phenylobacterium sp.]